MQVGRSVVRREGTDVALLAYGTVTNDALKAADILARSGVTATVVDMRYARAGPPPGSQHCAKGATEDAWNSRTHYAAAECACADRCQKAVWHQKVFLAG